MPRKSSRTEAGGTYRSILVPLDGSSLSEQALPLAVAIAERAGAKLRLVLVHQLRPVPLSAEGRKLYVSLENAARKSEKAYLKTFTDQLKKQSSSLAITSRTLTGPVAGTLIEHIHESKTDLVVMTSRGQGGFRRFWLGSVADAMIRGSPVPVLLVRPEETASPTPILENLGQILVPLDRSPLAEAILDPAKKLASLAGAELMLVEVVHPLAAPLESQSSHPSQFEVGLTVLRRKEATDYLRRIADECLEAGVKATYSAPLGASVADTILGLAESSTYGMIALATHGRGGVKRLALGSVADKVVRAAPRPILVYQPPKRARFPLL
jgi:nucleotide-binding universal stress UspA family protein